MRFLAVLVFIGFLSVGCSWGDKGLAVINIGTSEKSFETWIRDNSLEEFSVDLISLSAPNQDERRRAVFLKQRIDRHFVLVTFNGDAVVKIEDVRDRLSTGLSFKNWEWKSVLSINARSINAR